MIYRRKPHRAIQKVAISDRDARIGALTLLDSGFVALEAVDERLRSPGQSTSSAGASSDGLSVDESATAEVVQSGREHFRRYMGKMRAYVR